MTAEPTTDWKSDENAGVTPFRRERTYYERFIEEQGVPLVEGVGIYDVRDLTLAPWKRLGGKGAIIKLAGTGNVTGMFVLEVPGSGALIPERHLYEERMLVIEGRGTVEVWTDSNPRKQVFEWQPGSLFSFPLNTWHRLVNATSSPALVLGVTTAPNVINLFPDSEFVFNNPYEWKSRFDPAVDSFKPKDGFVAHHEQTGRAMFSTNLIPDVVNCTLPVDNVRVPGYRWSGLGSMAGNTSLEGFVGEYPTGRYSKAHYHESSAILVCLKGRGYTLNWRKELGPQPWAAGKGDEVVRYDYKAGGMVAAAPGAGDWFHQHFSAGAEPMRVMNITGTSYAASLGRLRGEELPGVAMELQEGGIAIGYKYEDPYVRELYKQEIGRHHVPFQMDEALFQKP